MRNLINLVEGIEEKTHFASEDEITNDDLRQIFDSIEYLASSEHMFNFGASLYYYLNSDDRIAYFNNVIVPIYEEFKFPIPGRGNYLEFQDAVVKMWRENYKKEDGVDYGDYDVLRAIAGL